jgi:hypothetical protein
VNKDKNSIENTAPLLGPVKLDFLRSVQITTYLLISLLSLTPATLIKSANGDGLFMEELSASFGDRKADLIIKMTPPVVTLIHY